MDRSNFLRIVTFFRKTIFVRDVSGLPEKGTRQRRVRKRLSLYDLTPYPTYFSTRNPMVTLNLTLNITFKLQRPKNRFFNWNPHFLLQI
uniref:Uncharacterized protein n=1 Tax=Trichogramma kaykai TaxID=54128 RepID=A0ABD2WVK6_9HYME